MSGSELSVHVVIPFKDNLASAIRLEKWICDKPLPEEYKITLVHDVFYSSECNLHLSRIKSKFDDERFRLLKGKYGSPGVARNAGLAELDSEWIAFWDADDLPNPINFLDMVRQGREKGAKVCIGGYEVEKNVCNRKYVYNVPPSRFSVAFSPGIWRMAFHSELLKGKTFSQALWGEDQKLMFDLEIFRWPFYLYKKNVYRYFLGSHLQLTSDKSNSKHLYGILKHCLETTNRLNHRRSNFLYAILNFRMLVTILKSMPNLDILPVLNQFVKIYLLNPKKCLLEFIPSVLVVIILTSKQKAFQGWKALWATR